MDPAQQSLPATLPAMALSIVDPRVPTFENYYRSLDSSAESAVRGKVFDQDIGQRSWTHVRDFERFGNLLRLDCEAHLLDYGCGFGGPSLWFGSRFRCGVTGVDINRRAIEHAATASQSCDIPPRVKFLSFEPQGPLPLEDGSVTAVLMNDVICHVPGRERALRECFRVLRPGASILITDPLVVEGELSNAEVVARNMKVEYFYVPGGFNEQALTKAGFVLDAVEDTTDRLTSMAVDNLRLRDQFRAELVASEGEEEFRRITGQLLCIKETSETHRLMRMLYLAHKPSA